MRTALLMGCGHSRIRKLTLERLPAPDKLVTLDMNPECGADVVWDLERRPLPFKDGEFDELHAYDVLEHIGRQGDWRGYFEEFSEYWRILSAGGLFSIIVPIGSDYFADPGHTRFFSKNHFGFLNQRFYSKSKEEGAATTDYRWFWKHNFEILHMQEQHNHHLAVMLVKT